MGWRWYLAKCEDCDPPITIPFRSVRARDEWLKAHREISGHDAVSGGSDDA